jgi:hypothetical protein
VNERDLESGVERPGRDIRGVGLVSVQYPVHERRVHILAACIDAVQSRPAGEEVFSVECLDVFDPTFDLSVVRLIPFERESASLRFRQHSPLDRSRAVGQPDQPNEGDRQSPDKQQQGDFLHYVPG